MRAASRSRGVKTTTRPDPVADLQHPRARALVNMPASAFVAASGSGYSTDTVTKMANRSLSHRIRHTAVGTSTSAAAAIPGGAVDFTNRNILFWFMREYLVGNALGLNKVQIEVSSDNFGATGAQFQFTPGADQHLRQVNTWMPVEFPTKINPNPAGGGSPFGMPYWYASSGKAEPNWAAITHLKFGMTTTAGAGSTNSQMTLWLGGIEAISKPPEPVVSFVFDRFSSYNYVSAVPILDAAGWKATFRGQVGQLIDLTSPSLMTLAQAKALHDNGHDIGVYDYPATGFTDGAANYGGSLDTAWANRSKATVLAAMRLAQQRLIENGMPETVDQLAGQSRKLVTDGYTDIILPHFNYVDIPNNDEYPSFWPPIDPLAVPNKMYVKSIDDADGLHTRLKQTIDRAVTNKEWLTLLCHDVHTSVIDGFTLTPAKFQDIVDYVAAAGVKVRTVRQVLHRQV